MKRRTFSILASLVTGLWILAPLPRGTSAAGAAPPDKSSASPARGEGKKKKNRDDGPTGTKPQKEIPFPLLINQPTSNLRIPDMDAAGKVLSVLMAEKATRLDDEHVQMHAMRLDLNKADGKQDYHIVMPTSIFNLKTHIIASQEPVSVQTQDFELTGEKMEFNTVEREGRLLGHVRMVIHNLKQMADPQATPKPE